MFSKEDLRTIVEHSEQPCVSFFLPTHRAGKEVEQDSIRLKNLLGQAEENLVAAGHRSATARRWLKPVREILEDGFFWRHQSEGLAIFLSPTLFSHYCLPLAFEELLVVGNRFHVKPLLPLLTHDRTFYILALSQNEVRFFAGTRNTVTEISLHGVPHSLADALKYDDPERQLQFHTRTAPSRARRQAMFHGHGVGIDDYKDRISRYFHLVDAHLHPLFKQKTAPLVLAGVEYLFPLYRSANTYPYLLDEGISGNPELLDAALLHERAWRIVQAHFEETEEDSARRYRELAGTGQTSREIATSLVAAYHGYVDSLFVAAGVQVWGGFDPSADVVHIYPERRLGAVDLLDLTAIYTWLTQGRVFVVPLERLPDQGPLAAIFRYPATIAAG